MSLNELREVARTAQLEIPEDIGHAYAMADWLIENLGE